MSDSTDFGFAKLVPGFDFLQNLAKGASQGLSQMPTLSNWVAPTLNVEELDKRIGELKAVHFWLDQNSKALGATIQALEVQKMTLATLRGMNFSMGELADALKLKTPDVDNTPARKPAEAAAAETSAAPKPAEAKRARPAAKQPGAKAGNAGGAAPVDPLQWWGALTQQFQQIAANAMQDVAQQGAGEGAGAPAAKTGGGSAQPATKAAKAAAPVKKAARKAPARKTRAKT